MNKTVLLKNGVQMPSIGYGTWQIEENQAEKAVISAIECGYRHIDTAAIYQNERGVGSAVNNCGLDRQQLFITSKLWNSERDYDRALRAFEDSMKRLNLEYLDLYLIHWSCNKDGWQAINAGAWRALEKLYKDGRVRSIGVSNFLNHHITELLRTAEVVPMVNQIEYHAGYRQIETVQLCQELGVVVEAWSPLGMGKLLDHPVICQIAKNYHKTAAQILIRYCLQNGIVPLPKSVNSERMAQNLAVFDFEIAKDDMQALDRLPTAGFSGMHPDKVPF